MTATATRARRRRRPRDVPAWVPRRHIKKWRNPHATKARLSPGFRRLLRRHGYLSPNFRLVEARCKCGADVPPALMRNAQNHAFNLEQLRHELDGPAITVLSWYRPDWYNRQIGGATFSQHIEALASDMTREWVERVGRARFDRAADKVFRDGGVGRYPAGSVHCDSRGWRARWTSF